MSLLTSFRRSPAQDPASTDDPTPEPPAPDAGAGAGAEPTAPDGGDDSPAADAAAAAEQGRAADDSGDAPAADDRAAERRRRIRVVARHTVTVLAFLLVAAALLLPNRLGRLTPAAFVRIPLEAVLGVGLILVLQAWARRPLAILAGACVGLLAVLKTIDMGFYQVLSRPFDPVLDWVLLDDAFGFLTDSVGRAGAIAAAVGIVLLVVAVLALTALASMRLAGVVTRHRRPAGAAAAALLVAWVGCAAAGVYAGPGLPVADRGTSGLLHHRAHLVSLGLRDQQAFAAEAAVDAFRDTPPDRLLTALRGKDVVFAFVESYGRDAVEDPRLARQVGVLLDEGYRRLGAAGFDARSGFLTSPTSGGGSWLAHATFASGLWISNEQRYRNLVSSDRLTLTGAFQRAGEWDTVGVMPGIRRAWPEGNFYGFDRVHDSRNMGYRGPAFSWAPMPDQYTLAAYERMERSRPGRAPLMAEIALVSSHGPWVPIPRLIPWEDVGDGSVFEGIAKEGDAKSEVWKSATRVRAAYRQSIEYSLGSLISYVQTYGDDDLVLVFLGDHQPVPLVTGEGASRDVPITIVARDSAVLDRISGWGWDEGLQPGPEAPVWRMDTFRDRFLTAFGPQD